MWPITDSFPRKDLNFPGNLSHQYGLPMGEVLQYQALEN